MCSSGPSIHVEPPVDDAPEDSDDEGVIDSHLSLRVEQLTADNTRLRLTNKCLAGRLTELEKRLRVVENVILLGAVPSAASTSSSAAPMEATKSSVLGGKRGREEGAGG